MAAMAAGADSKMSPKRAQGGSALSAQGMQREAVRQCQARYLRPSAAHPGLAHGRRGNLTGGETPSRRESHDSDSPPSAAVL